MLHPSPTPPSTQIRVGIYARISEAEDGDTQGVDRQVRDGELLCQVRDWVVHDTYIDNDTSAFKWDRIRPQFNRLLADLESGVIQGIVGYNLDRIARLPIDLERLLKIYDFARNQGNSLVFATKEGDINLASDDGLTLARVMVAFANKESRNISRRVKAKHAELARNGIPIGGARSFGYKASPEAYQALVVAEMEGNEVAAAAARVKVKYEERRRLDPFEAKLLRDGAHDILAGHGIYELVKRWNDAGYRSPRGHLWRASTIRGMYLSPKMAGFRVHRGQIALDDQGNRVRGEYEPVLNEATWEAVVKVITERAQIGARPGRRKHLLTGMLRCGLCGTRMKHDTTTAKGSGSIYRCPHKNDGGGCGKVSINGPKTEYHVGLLWKMYATSRDISEEVEAWPREEELEGLTQKIGEVMEAYHVGQLSSQLAFPMIERIEKDIARLRTERAEWVQAQHRVSGQPINIEDWDNMTIAEQRVELMQLLSAIVIHPATRLGCRFDPARIEPLWHDAPSAESRAAAHLSVVGL